MDEEPGDARGATVDTPVEGLCDPAFAAVEDAFRENFRSRNEVGGGVCVLLSGRPVVDLWGGHREIERRPPGAATPSSMPTPSARASRRCSL